MSPENQWLEAVFPMKTVPFLGGHVSFRGCTYQAQISADRLLCWLLGNGEPPRSAREVKSPHPIVAPNQSPREAKHSGRSAIRGRSLEQEDFWKLELEAGKNMACLLMATRDPANSLLLREVGSFCCHYLILFTRFYTSQLIRWQ